MSNAVDSLACVAGAKRGARELGGPCHGVKRKLVAFDNAEEKKRFDFFWLRVVSNFGNRDCGAGEIDTRARAKQLSKSLQRMHRIQPSLKTRQFHWLDGRKKKLFKISVLEWPLVEVRFLVYKAFSFSSLRNSFLFRNELGKCATSALFISLRTSQEDRKLGSVQ